VSGACHRRKETLALLSQNQWREQMTLNKLKLFGISSLVANLHGYNDVSVEWFVDERPQRLFGPDGSLGISYSDLVKSYDASDPHAGYAEIAVEEYFTEAEAEAFTAWAKVHRHDDTATTSPASLPVANNIMPLSAIPCGGGSDFLLTGEADDYDLSFKVHGYYDAKLCEFDETLRGAHRAWQGVRIVNGRIEPWFLEDAPRKVRS
jgi:hypothetical protein